MKNALLLQIFLFAFVGVFGQNLNKAGLLSDAANMGESPMVIGFEKRIISIEHINDNIDVDMDTGIFIVNRPLAGKSNSVVLEYDSNHHFIQVHEFEGNGAINNINLNYVNGNYYLGAHVTDSVDFDFSAANSYAISGQTGSRFMMAKYDSQFNLVWLKSFGLITSSNRVNLDDMFVSPEGEIYATGAFRGQNDFDLGSGTFFLNGGVSNFDLYFAKYNTNGDLIFAKEITASGTGNIYSQDEHILALSDSSIVFTFRHDGGFDVDPDTGSHIVSGEMGFIGRYDKNGNFLFQINTHDDFFPKHTAVGDSNNFFICGQARKGAYFDYPNPISEITTSSGSIYSSDMFLVKYNSNGQFKWLRESSSGSQNINVAARKIEIDPITKMVYVGGYFSGSWQLLSPAKNIPLISPSHRVMYVSKYDQFGDLKNAYYTRGDTLYGNALFWDFGVIGNDKVVVRGSIQHRHDLDPSFNRSYILRPKYSNHTTVIASFIPNLAPQLSSIADTTLCAQIDTISFPFTLIDDFDTNATVFFSSSDTNLIKNIAISATDSGTFRQVQIPITHTLIGNTIITGVVFDGDSISDTLSFQITLQKPIIDSIKTTNPPCFGDSSGQVLIFPPLSNLDYGYNGLFQGSSTLNGVPAGNFEVQVKDNIGCVASDSVTLLNPAQVKIDTVIATNPACFNYSDGSIAIIASGGTGDLTFALNAQTFLPDSFFTALGSGMYAAFVSDSLNCMDSNLVNLLNPQKVVVDSLSVTHVTCFGDASGAIFISGSGGNTSLVYRDLASGQQNAIGTFSSFVSGNYQIIIEDSIGCDDTLSVSINQPTKINPTYTISSTVTCFGGIDGQISAAASGGQPPYLFSADGVNFNASNIINGLTATGKLLYVKDSLNCVVDTPITISQPVQIIVNLTKDSDISCFGETDGQVSVTANGGNGGFQYSINGLPYSTSTTFGNLPPNFYSVTAKDQANCTGTSSTIQIIEPDSILINSQITDETLGNDGAILVTATGGNGGYSFKIDNGTYGGNNNFTGLTKGTYTIWVNDAKACENSKLAEVGSKVSIEESSGNKFQIFPNPSSNLVFIKSDQTINNIVLTNASGQQVLNETNISNQYQIEVSSLPSGVYFLEVSNENSTEKTRLIIR